MHPIQDLDDYDLKEWYKMNEMIYIRDSYMLIKQDRNNGERVADRRWRLAFVLLSGCGLQIYPPGTTTKQLVHEIFMDVGTRSSPLAFIPFEINTRTGILHRKKYFVSMKKVLTLRNCSEDTVYFLRPGNGFKLNDWNRTLKYALQRYQEWYCRISKKYLLNHVINTNPVHSNQINRELMIDEKIDSHNIPQIDTIPIKLSLTLRSTNACDIDPRWATPIDMINNFPTSPTSLKSCISDETEITLQNSIDFKDKIDIEQKNLILNEPRSLPESNWMQFYQKRTRKNMKFAK